VSEPTEPEYNAAPAPVAAAPVIEAPATHPPVIDPPAVAPSYPPAAAPSYPPAYQPATPSYPPTTPSYPPAAPSYPPAAPSYPPAPAVPPPYGGVAVTPSYGGIPVRPPKPPKPPKPPRPDGPRQANAGITAALVAGGLIVGAVLDNFVVDRQLGGVDLLPFGVVLLFLDVVLPAALAGAAAAVYLRPAPGRIIAAALTLAVPTLVPIIMRTDIGDLYNSGISYDLISSLFGFVYRAIPAAAAACAWLVLRGRAPVKLLFGIGAGLVAYALAHGVGSSNGLHAPNLLPAVAAAWLAVIGTTTAAAPTPAGFAPAPAGFSPAQPGYPVPAPYAPTGYVTPQYPGAEPVPAVPPGYQVLFNAAGERVFIPAPSSTNGLAIASLVLGLVGLCVTGIPAVITGHIARSQIKRTGQSGDGLALAGLIIGYVVLGLELIGVLNLLSVH
jgi:hypothetical protein